MLQKKVLIVDDSPSQVKLIQGFLEHEGYRLVGINDPERVEEAIAIERPSVILLDVVMPKRNGFQVCRELKNSSDYNAIPVILVTSKEHGERQILGPAAGRRRIRDQAVYAGRVAASCAAICLEDFLRMIWE